MYRQYEIIEIPAFVHYSKGIKVQKAESYEQAVEIAARYASPYYRHVIIDRITGEPCYPIND